MLIKQLDCVIAEAREQIGQFSGRRVIYAEFVDSR